MSTSVLPSGIGSHERHEFELMRIGQKDVALFSEIEPDVLNEMLAHGHNLLKFRALVNTATV